ncbi:response regulator [Rhodovibrio salinarum]|uniref:Response regulator n=1 Tax=Rhodovibrio salinarum TaxID=1087 RepID=A0A934QHF1_9PROT|nr:response regulator [Rhodovibrio salinarum]MBK1696570.1 response regulator [Rhodovibrio salinarum]
MATVLVIDDQADIRNVFAEVLQEAGYQVVTAVNGRDGLAKASSSEIDLIITDILMPERDGIEVIHEIKRTSGETPVVAVSGGGTMRGPDLLSIASKLHADATLQKPVDADALVRTVQELLGNKGDA